MWVADWPAINKFQYGRFCFGSGTVPAASTQIHKFNFSVYVDEPCRLMIAKDIHFSVTDSDRPASRHYMLSFHC